MTHFILLLRSLSVPPPLFAEAAMSGLLTALKTRFDDSEAGLFYRYTRGWVEYGNPAKAYRELIYLFQGFTDICNQHQIEYWLDWGSLLGYLRHDGGVIPCQITRDCCCAARARNVRIVANCALVCHSQGTTITMSACERRCTTSSSRSSKV